MFIRNSAPASAAAVVLLAAQDTSAFERVCDREGTYLDSPSCYNSTDKVVERPGIGRFDISKETFAAMVERASDMTVQAIQPRSPLRETLPALQQRIHDLPADQMIFFYWNNKGQGNPDCHLYAGVKREERPVDPIALTPRIDHDPCNRASRDFTYLFRVVTESTTALMVTPTEKYLLAAHPDDVIYKEYEDAYVDGWFLFVTEFNLPDELVPERETWEEILIPTWDHTLTESMSLSHAASEVAEEMNLGPGAVELIWELNIGGIESPAAVAEGQEIVVPASIVRWDKTEYEGLEADEIAEKHYNDEDYATLVRFLRQLESESGDFLPQFEAPGALELTPVVVVQR